MKLLYLLILAVLAVFYAMYYDMLSFLLLVTAAVFPLLELLLLAVSAALMKAEIVETSLFSRRNIPCEMELAIDSRSFLPFCSAEAELICVNGFDGRESRIKVDFHIMPRAKQRVGFSVTSAHSGPVSVRLKRIRIFDTLRLFSVTKRAPDDSISLFVFPEVYEINPPMEAEFEVSGDSEAYIARSKGDDPSEIYELRDYQQGDRQNRIHWKLSSKQENYIVKELSENKRSSVLVLIELLVRGSDITDRMDRALDACASAEAFLKNSGVPHDMGAFCTSDDTFFVQPVTNEESCYSFYGRLFREKPYNTKPYGLVYCSESSGNVYSHIIYITADSGSDTIDLISECGAGGELTVLDVSGEKALSAALGGKPIQIIQS